MTTYTACIVTTYTTLIITLSTTLVVTTYITPVMTSFTTLVITTSEQGSYDSPENSHRNRGKVPFWGSIELLNINHVDYSKVVSVDCLLVSQYDRNF